jgi:hypothetical protein
MFTRERNEIEERGGTERAREREKRGEEEGET